MRRELTPLNLRERMNELIDGVIRPFNATREGRRGSISEIPVKTMAMINLDDLSSRALARGTIELAKKKGLQVVISEAYPHGTTDLSTVLTKVRAANPDVLGGATRFEDALAITRQLKALNVNPRMVGLTVGVDLPKSVDDIKAPSRKSCRASPQGQAQVGITTTRLFQTTNTITGQWREGPPWQRGIIVQSGQQGGTTMVAGGSYQMSSSITEIAKKFFDACDQGKGWDVCKQYCTPDATFSAQAEPLADLRNLQQYTDWMKGLLTFIPNGRYEVKSFATDAERKSVCAYGVFSGTHTGQGGPCPPTGKSLKTDYVYVMMFEGEKIRHMQKIWHAGLAMKDLGWV